MRVHVSRFLFVSGCSASAGGCRYTRNTHAQCLCLAHRARSQSVIVGVVSCGRKTKVRRSVHRAKFSCRSCAKLLKILLRRMAKRCQEEYEDVSEVLHPSTLSTLYMYVPRLNVCLTCLR